MITGVETIRKYAAEVIRLPQHRFGLRDHSNMITRYGHYSNILNRYYISLLPVLYYYYLRIIMKCLRKYTVVISLQA